MADITFVDKQTLIPTSWYQDINDFVYDSGFNGLSASQFLRSDVSDTFTGSLLEISNATPRLVIEETDAASNNQRWDITGSVKRLIFRALNDIDTVGAEFLRVGRTDTTIDSVDLTATKLSIISPTSGDSAQVALEIKNTDNYWTRFIQRDSAAGYNSLVSAGDHALIFSNALIDTGALVIGPWSSSRKGIRLDAVADSIDLSATTINLNGDVVSTGNLDFTDNKGVIFGAGDDVAAYWTSTDLNIDFQITNGNLQIRDNLDVPQFTFDTDLGNLTLTGHIDTGVAAVTSGLTHVFAETGSDGVIRKITPANFISDLNLATEGPAFRANRSANVTFGVTQTVPFNVETFDTDNCYDPTTNYRFTPTKAGYYLVQLNGKFSSVGSGSIYLTKNGGAYGQTQSMQASMVNEVVALSDIMYLNGTGDYFSVFFVQIAGTNTLLAGSAISASFLHS